MKRIGILSDTHGLWDDRFAAYFSDCDEIWHAGDIGDYAIIERLAEETGALVRSVSGNIDHGMVRRKCSELEIFECGGIRVLLTHIGGYPGRWSKGMKKLLADERIGLMVDGHSHILKIMYDRDLGLLHINPGAAGNQGWHSRRTIVRLKIADGVPSDCEVIELGTGNTSNTSNNSDTSNSSNNPIN